MLDTGKSKCKDLGLSADLDVGGTEMRPLFVELNG